MDNLLTTAELVACHNAVLCGDTVRIPIFNGFVEIATKRFIALVTDGNLEAFKKRYEPSTYCASVYASGGGTSHIIANVRKNNAF